MPSTIQALMQGALLRLDAGWSSLVARRAHNPKVVGSNPAPATNIARLLALHFRPLVRAFFVSEICRGRR